MINIFRLQEQENGGDFITGNTFTMADVYLYPHLAFCVYFGLDITKYPGLQNYYKVLQSRDSISKTWPPSWSSESPKGSFLEPI